MSYDFNQTFTAGFTDTGTVTFSEWPVALPATPFDWFLR